jgi:hypothetical protein
MNRGNDVRVAVITVGSKRESLGAMKLANWMRRLGHEVSEQTDMGSMLEPFDLYCFSAVFSWQLPKLVDMASTARQVYGKEVWVGGPAVTFHPDNSAYVERETGVKPHVGLDDRFETEPGDYPMVYFSRGCPAYTPACGACPVPRIEGRSFKYYPKARPAPFLLDNNLSALPQYYQRYIIRRYEDAWKKNRRVDANSGFEPHTFDEATLDRWKSFPLLCWRFGYDDLSERDQSLEMMRLLKYHGIDGERVRVYCLIGLENRDDCLKRVREVIDNGMHPWPQRFRPLNWLGGPLPVFHDWDEPTLVAFQRFYSFAGLWKKMRPSEFFYQGRYPLDFAK